MNVTDPLFHFLSGAIAMAFAIAGLFFLRFWRRTGDGLFAAFAGAFWLLALVQTLLALTEYSVEERSFIYLIRLAAFVTILLAIWRKNKAARR